RVIDVGVALEDPEARAACAEARVAQAIGRRVADLVLPDRLLDRRDERKLDHRSPRPAIRRHTLWYAFSPRLSRQRQARKACIGGADAAHPAAGAHCLGTRSHVTS